MAYHGFLDADRDPMLAIPHPNLLKGIKDQNQGSATLDGIVDEVPEIKNFIYEGRIMDFF